jgi:poly(A) polymerase
VRPGKVRYSLLLARASHPGAAHLPHRMTRHRKRDDSRSDSRADSSPRRKPKREAPEAIYVPADEIDHNALDRDARRVVMRLQNEGYEAYFVGGCVRDLMIGRVPKDFDVATSARPREVSRLFGNGRIIGRRFKLVHIRYGNKIIETATFRAEPRDQGEKEDLLIREDNEFGTAGEDARRRDFTVNGLFLDPATDEIIDYVDGLYDLDKRILRTIGDPYVRLAEDPVRIMRAIKFATRLDFHIHQDTWDAMCEQAEQLERSAPPRVLEEILRLVRSGSALGAFRMMRDCGVLTVLLPQLAEFLGPRPTKDPKVKDRAGSFWALLEALDSRVHQGWQPTTAVCIALMFVLVVEDLAERDDIDVDEAAWEILEPLASHTRLSRRDFSRARRIITLLPQFTQGPSKRFSPLLFARSEDFPEALDLFGLRAHARGKGWDIYEGWVARSARARGAEDDELDEERRRTRTRKRRRRRRRSPGDKG